MNEQADSRKKKIYRDGFLIAVSILFAVVIYQSLDVEMLVNRLYGISFLLGIFLTGIFFASTFTVAISTSLFLLFSQHQNPFLIAAVGGFGAFLGDTLIFKFLKDDLIADFEYLEKFFPEKVVQRIIHSKLIFWFAPILAAIMIASPLPDEIGLIMLAGIKLRYHHFFLLSYSLNTVGILVICLFGSVFT